MTTILTTARPVPRRHDGPPLVAVLPRTTTAALESAVEEGGGVLTDLAEAEAVVWTDPRSSADLATALAEHPDIVWVQLPFAGVEPFLPVFDRDRVWTCGKGVYAEPVAEHALALLLGGMRHVVGYAREPQWSAPVGRNLLGARVVVLGGGEITRSLLRLLSPFGCDVTVVRRHPQPMEHDPTVVGPDELDSFLPTADAVVLALALTPETEHVLDARRLQLLPDHAWIVNVARGRHIDTDALVTALREGRLGGAALDVTDPEPLPEDHPLWTLSNVVITPHTANTSEMGRPLLAARVRENVRRFASDEPLLGPVDVELQY